MVSFGVLEPVLVGEPVTWCHHMVICAKKNGKPRQTVDFQAFNLHATRETHHTQSPFHLARSVPGGTKKTVFNCWNGYYSVLLHPDDHHLTTFITLWGRHRYKTATQGYIASGDLLASKSPPPKFGHARNTMTQYVTSQQLQTSPLCSPGLEYKPSVVCLRCNRAHATLPPVTQTWHTIQIGQ